MKPFRREPEGFVAELDAGERAVLAQLAADVAQMLRVEVPGVEEGGTSDPEGWRPPGWSGPSQPAGVPVPEDPAVRRLLPPASQDEAVASEFRRLTTPSLAAEKVRRLDLLARLLVGTGSADARDTVVVLADDAPRVAGALTDVRLVLAERLHLLTDEQVEGLYDEFVEPGDCGAVDTPAGDASARRFLVGVFLLAGLLQDSLVDGMLRDLRRPPRP